MKALLEFTLAFREGVQERILESLKKFRLAVEKFPGSAYVHGALGTVLRQLHEPYSAYLSFEKAVELEPLNAAYLAQAAVSLHEATGEGEVTVQRLERALDMDPHLVSAYEYLAQVKNASGDLEGALAGIEKGLAASRNLHDFQTLLALRRIIRAQAKVKARMTEGRVEAALNSLLLGT
jgi:tetratricopeptide (TPR) repeat protein